MAEALELATQLDSLRLCYCEAEYLDILSDLPALPKLRKLDLSENDWLHGDSLSFLAKVPALEELTISECQDFAPEHAEHIAGLRALRFLELHDCEVFERGAFDPLRTMAELRYLDIGLIDDIEPSDLYFVSELPRLTELNLWSVPFDQTLLERIATCTSLTMLSLNSTTLDENWLPAPHRSPRLDLSEPAPGASH